MGISLDAGAVDRLEAFADLLKERGSSLGLVSKGDLPHVYGRHVLDSLRAAAAFTEGDSVAYDLGSGGGLPGVVLASALPRCRFVLVEPRTRRAGFLELVIERLGLNNAEVAVARAEDLPPERADVCTARALAPLPEAWRLARPLLRSGGRLVYFAGEGVENPGEDAGALPDPPGGVELLDVLASEPPLVIMTRR
jgi:16S rRNA (guanine527-N7)-methyltransferase